ARDPDRKQRAAAELFVLVVVMVVAAHMSAAVAKAAPEDRDPDRDHEHAGEEVQPGIERLGDDELGESQRDEAEREDADRVRRRHDPAERVVLTEVTSRGPWSMFFGYARSSSLMLCVCAPTTISLQPIRSR